MTNAKTIGNFHSIFNSVVDDIGNAVHGLVTSSSDAPPSETKRYGIGKEIIIDPMIEWEKRRSVLKKNRSSQETITFDKGIPLKKVRRKKKTQVAMVDTVRLRPVPAVARLSTSYSSSSVASIRSTSSNISIIVRHGLK